MKNQTFAGKVSHRNVWHGVRVQARSRAARACVPQGGIDGHPGAACQVIRWILIRKRHRSRLILSPSRGHVMRRRDKVSPISFSRINTAGFTCMLSFKLSVTIGPSLIRRFFARKNVGAPPGAVRNSCATQKLHETETVAINGDKRKLSSSRHCGHDERFWRAQWTRRFSSTHFFPVARRFRQPESPQPGWSISGGINRVRHCF